MVLVFLSEDFVVVVVVVVDDDFVENMFVCMLLNVMLFFKMVCMFFNFCLCLKCFYELLVKSLWF